MEGASVPHRPRRSTGCSRTTKADSPCKGMCQLSSHLCSQKSETSHILSKGKLSTGNRDYRNAACVLAVQGRMHCKGIDLHLIDKVPLKNSSGITTKANLGIVGSTSVFSKKTKGAQPLRALSTAQHTVTWILMRRHAKVLKVEIEMLFDK